MNPNNTSTEVIETPLGALSIPVPNLEFISEISPIEQYRINLYRYFHSRKTANPDCEISVTDVITVPIKMMAMVNPLFL